MRQQKLAGAQERQSDKSLDGVVTAGVLLHHAAEHQVQASARSDSRSCYNCLANNNYLQMSADEGLTNGEAGGLCWLRRDYLGELTSAQGLPKITETFPLLLRQLLQHSGHPCPSLVSSCHLLPWAGSPHFSLSHSSPVLLPQKPRFNPWQPAACSQVVLGGGRAAWKWNWLFRKDAVRLCCKNWLVLLSLTEVMIQ